MLALGRAKFEIKLVKTQPFYELPQSLWLETGDGWIAQVLILRPIGADDGIEKLLVQLKKL